MITKYIAKAPCEVVHMQLGMPQEYREQLIQESYRLKNRKDRENPLSMVDVFNETYQDKVMGSSYLLWRESNLYNILLRNILITIQHMVCPPGSKYGIVNAWLGIYNKEQFGSKHSHEPSYKSFCYYINAEEPYTPIVFDDVGVEIDAVTARLVVFPSHLQHSVPPCKGGERIMIAGNISPYEGEQYAFMLDNE